MKLLCSDGFPHKELFYNCFITVKFPFLKKMFNQKKKY